MTRQMEQQAAEPGAAPAVLLMIVDDHPIAREGLRAMLATCREIELVGEASTAEEALELMPHLKPMVILMDYKMPGMDGISAARQIRELFPHVAVIIMTSYEEQAVVLEALQAGVSGYLVKDASFALLQHTIHAVAQGGSLVKASLLRQMLCATIYGTPTPRQSPAQSPMLEQLTERERRIVQLLAEGQTNRAIATTLGFAEITVKKHVQTVIAKLYASDRTHAAVTAMRLGLIS